MVRYKHFGFSSPEPYPYRAWYICGYIKFYLLDFCTLMLKNTCMHHAEHKATVSLQLWYTAPKSLTASFRILQSTICLHDFDPASFREIHAGVVSNWKKWKSNKLYRAEKSRGFTVVWRLTDTWNQGPWIFLPYRQRPYQLDTVSPPHRSNATAACGIRLV